MDMGNGINVRGGKQIASNGKKEVEMIKDKGFGKDCQGNRFISKVQGKKTHLLLINDVFYQRQGQVVSAHHQAKTILQFGSSKIPSYLFSNFDNPHQPNNQSRIIIKIKRIMSNRSDSNKGKMLMALMSKIIQKPKENPELISSANYAQQIQAQESQDERNSEASHGLLNNGCTEESFSEDGKSNTNQEWVQGKNMENLASIFTQLYGEDQYEKTERKLKRENMSNRNYFLKLQEYLLDNILEEIARLQQVQTDAINSQKLFQKSAKGGSNQEKWKLVVMSYRQKLQKSQQKLEEQKRMKKKIEKELNARNQDVQRLSNMNNLRFQKINVYIEELQEQKAENEEMSQAINEMELNLSVLKEKTEKVEHKLASTERQKEMLAQQLVEMSQSLQEISQTLQAQRQKSILYERQRQAQCFNQNVNVLGRQDQQINREIHDLKQKYQYEILQLQIKLRDYHIQREEMQLQILELQHSNPTRHPICTDVSTQTQVNIVKACYFSSLQDDLQGECQPQQPGNNSQHNHQDNLSDFELNLNLNSANSHAINTPRDFDHLSDKDHNEDNYYQHYNDASFQQEKSTSNAPSRYMETMEQLTAELAEAYQRINQLTSQLSLLEDENRRLAGRTQEKSTNDKSIGGYLTNFFKK